MSSFKPIDPKRDEFRRYLERSGVIEALTKVFVHLMRAKERPADPLKFLRLNLGDHLHEADNVAYLEGELTKAHSKIQSLRKLIERVDPSALEETCDETNDITAEVTHALKCATVSVPVTDDLSMTKSGVKEEGVVTANVESPQATAPDSTDVSDDAELVAGEVSKGTAVDNCQTNNTNSSNSA